MNPLRAIKQQLLGMFWLIERSQRLCGSLANIFLEWVFRINEESLFLQFQQFLQMLLLKQSKLDLLGSHQIRYIQYRPFHISNYQIRKIFTSIDCEANLSLSFNYLSIHIHFNYFNSIFFLIIILHIKPQLVLLYLLIYFLNMRFYLLQPHPYHLRTIIKRPMSKREEYACTLKTLIIGNSGVGKSCLLIRFSEDKFQGNLLNTIGVDFKTKYVTYQGERVKLVLWDTAGQDRFRTITNSYYRNANGIIILYDITDRDSFNQVAHWYDEMNKNIDQKVACYIVGNKADLTAKRAVSYEEGFELANRYQLPFMETSAKTAQNVNELFEELTGQMMKLGQGAVKSARRPPPLPFKNEEEENCKCCN